MATITVKGKEKAAYSNAMANFLYRLRTKMMF
jgi:hypothetical protein